MKRPFLLVPSLVTAALVFAAATIYPFLQGRLATAARRFYGSTDDVLYPFLAMRVVGYRPFFWILLGVLGAWCIVLCADRHAKRSRSTFSRPLPRYLTWIAEGVVFVSMVAVAVVLSDREWRRFGEPCWDNYCLYPELVLGWFRHPSSETWMALHSFLRADYHCNSPVVPVLVALTELVSGASVVAAYRFLSGAATLLALLTLFSFLRRKLGVSIDRAGLIVLLLISHLVVIRSFCFPQTDAFVFLGITLALTQSALFTERPTRRRAVACFIVLTMGLFIKLSFLPALAIIPLWTALDARAVNRDVIRRAAIFVLGPLLAFLAFQLALGLTGMYARELDRMQTIDSFPAFHLVSLLHAGAVLVPLIAIGRHRLTRTDRNILVWTGLYVLSLWGGRTSGWSRFYLAIIPPLAILSRHGIGVLAEELSTTSASIGVALYALTNYAALLLDLYQ
jgi:hypothetical protein